MWGSTIYNIEDLPMDPYEVAPQYTKFRQLTDGTKVKAVVPEPRAGDMPFIED